VEGSETKAPFPPGHLSANPLPGGICGALGIAGYQLLAEVAGVGAGRLGPQVFLLVAPDPDPAAPSPGTQVSLHHPRVKEEAEVAAFTQLAAQLGYLRLSGYRLALERSGTRSKINLMNPATGAVALVIPDRHPGRLFGGGANAARLLAAARSLPPAGPPPDARDPELLHQALLALALSDDSIDAAQAVEVADRAVELIRADGSLAPKAALERAKGGGA
jgi:hypothetical protein